MSDQTKTSDDDPSQAMSLASLICLQAARFYKQAERSAGGEDAGDSPGTADTAGPAGPRGSTGTLVDALEQAMVDLGYTRSELQKIWLVFLAGHRAAARAADRLPLSDEQFTAGLTARRHVCPLQDEEGCLVGSFIEA